MLSYVQYVWDRYVGNKGQGMVEYAVIALIVVAAATALYTSQSATGGLQGALTTLYTTLVTKIGAVTTGTPTK